MPVLKCIGGYNDGEYYEVGNLKVGDIFNIQEKVLTPVFDRSHLKNVGPIHHKINQYKIRKLTFYDTGQIYYMAPVELSDQEAVEWQFRK